ncbi:MAG: LptF/LptG family permease [Pseudomonadota bacterium]
MHILDRYILRQLIGPFMFFTVVFAALFWLNSALRIISFVVENGQSGGTFLAFAMLLLPQSLQLIVAVAGFAAALYLANSLYSNSELVVMMTAGQSPLRNVMPFAVFGFICFLLLMVLTNLVTPWSTKIIGDTRAEMRSALAAQLSQEARFLSPSDDVTVYFGTTNEEGGLGDVFIDDRSNGGQRQTYFSETGQFLNSDGELRLLLLNGTNQVLNTETGKLSTLKFESLSYNLSDLQENNETRRLTVRELGSIELISGSSDFSAEKEWGEVHQRVSLAIFAFLTPIFGALALLVSGFKRQGYTLNLVLASGVFIFIEAARGNMTRLVNNEVLPGPVMYVPVLVLMLLILGLVITSASGSRRKTSA